MYQPSTYSNTAALGCARVDQERREIRSLLLLAAARISHSTRLRSTRILRLEPQLGLDPRAAVRAIRGGADPLELLSHPRLAHGASDGARRSRSWKLVRFTPSLGTSRRPDSSPSPLSAGLSRLRLAVSRPPKAAPVFWISLHPQRLFLTLQPVQLLALVRTEPARALALIPLGLLDPLSWTSWVIRTRTCETCDPTLCAGSGGADNRETPVTASTAPATAPVEACRPSPADGECGDSAWRARETCIGATAVLSADLVEGCGIVPDEKSRPVRLTADVCQPEAVVDARCECRLRPGL